MPNEFSGSPQADKLDRRRKTWGWVFAGCGSILGIGAILVVLFLVMFARGRSEFTPPLEEFLTLIDQESYDQAYDSLGDQWKTTQSFDEFQDFVILVSNALGAHQSTRMTSVHYQKNLGSPGQANTVFIGRFEKAEATLRVISQKYGDAWRIEGLRYESDAIISQLTCPYCGTVNGYNARYCSSCGAPLKKPQSMSKESQRGGV